MYRAAVEGGPSARLLACEHLFDSCSVVVQNGLPMTGHLACALAAAGLSKTAGLVAVSEHSVQMS